MKIGLDLRMVGGGSGIDRYITEIFSELLAEDKKNDYVLFFRDEEQTKVFEKFGKKMVVTGISHYSYGEQFHLPGILRKEKLDLVHFPHFNVPLLYRKKFIVTIHDLTHTLVPGKKKSHFISRIAYNLVFGNAIRSSYKIIAVSNATRNAILDNYNVESQKIRVVHEGISHVYGQVDKPSAFSDVSNRFGITKPYILYVGEWRRYKNLPMLAQAFDGLIAQGLDIELVLVGKEDPFYPNIKSEITSIKNANKIKMLGKVSDLDLKLIYNAATLFVLPSLIEGFGLPVLEAQICKTPVACSDIPSLCEVAGSAAEYFDPNSLENMIETIKNLINNPDRLKELAELGLQNASNFSWSRAARETLEAYQ